MKAIAENTANRILAGADEERFLTMFFVLYKTARIIEGNNNAFKNQSGNFYDLLKRLLKNSDDVTIKVLSGRYFINGLMVRFNDKGLSGADSVVKEWRTLGVGGVCFERSVTREEMEQFFIFIAQIKPNSENLESLSEKLKSNEIPSIELLAQVNEAEAVQYISEEVRRKFRVAARSTFFKAMSVVQEVVVNTSVDKDINTSKTKRVIHSLIDHITRDESSLIELAAIKDFDDYTYAHSTNVCVYSLTLGVRLHLDRSRLSQLGFTALFHDIGKVKLPTDLIRKPDSFDENDWIQMQKHPLLGAKTILRNLRFDEHTARAARGALEHHINKDFTGYPMLRYKKRPVNLFSKIISIVDTFDALTSGRVYLKKAIEPEDVIKKMLYQMNVKFDKFLLKIFNDIIGIYPAGTLVLLNSDELALILTNNDLDKARPFVKIIGNAEGLLENPVWVDLSIPENYDKKIVRKVDPERFGLKLKDFILKD